jgi:hypothetical protein
MQVFAACVAFLPLAMYLLVLGWINTRPRPVVVSGVRETTALALALAGCVLVGPGQLLLPPAATQNFAGWVWLLLALFYLLVVALIILVARPRLVIYNIGRQELRAILVDLADQLDPTAKWAGDTLSLAGLGIELRIESFAPLANVSLIAGGDPQSPLAWQRLEASLRQALAGTRSTSGRGGRVMIAVGALLILGLAARVALHPAETLQGMLELIGK